MAAIPPSLLHWALPAFAAAAGGVATLLIKAWIGKRGHAAKAGKTEAEAEFIEAESLRESIQTLRERCNETDDQNTKMRASIVDLRVKVDECEEDRRELHRLHASNAKDLANALKRITTLESTLAVYERRLSQAGLKTTMEGT